MIRHRLIGTETLLPINTPFDHGEFRFPPNFLALADAETLFAYGIEAVEIPDPIPEDPVPATITRRQCAIELRERGMISPAEALAMTRAGEPPAMIAAVFDAMPEPDRTIALTDFAAATYERGNALLNGIMTATGATSADIDDFFRIAETR